MRKELIYTLLAIMLCASADAQTGEVTDSGTFVADATGRYVRLIGHEGVIVDYLYDTLDATIAVGVAVRPNDKLTLTLKYGGEGSVAVPGLPAITSLFDDEGRTTAVHADGKPIALVDYAPSGLVDAVRLPGRLTWKVSVPDSSGRFWQSVENAAGKVIASSLITDVTGTALRAWYDAVAVDLGVSMDSLTYELSTTNSLTTARDAKGAVAFYVVRGIGGDVGFSRDGTPLFYDLALTVFGGTMAPGSDLMISPAWDAQCSAVPNRLVLTASGAAGLYVESAGEKAIASAWTDRNGKKVGTVSVEVETVSNASR